MASNKQSTDKKAGWGKLGGSEHMHNFKGVGTQQPGGSAVSSDGGSRRGIEPKAGGSSKGFYSSDTKNKFGAGTQEPGGSATSGKREEGFAHGGKTHMYGNRGSQRQNPA
jgi:hypothetical protein